MPKAASLAAEIKEKTGLEPELIEGQKGIFDVKYGSELIFSKHEQNRFPEHDEVLMPLQKLLAD